MSSARSSTLCGGASLAMRRSRVVGDGDALLSLMEDAMAARREASALRVAAAESLRERAEADAAAARAAAAASAAASASAAEASAREVARLRARVAALEDRVWALETPRHDIIGLVVANGHLEVGEACAGLCRETWARAPSAGLSEADAARVRAGHPIWPRIINARHGKNGETRLMWAARTGRVARVRELCAWGADVNARSTRAGATALALASGANAADAVRELVARGAAVEAAQEDGRTSLLVACDAGALGAVRKLLARGVDANVEAATPDGKTCLMRAAAAGCAAVVAELLVRGAKPDATSRDGSTALHFCCTDDDYVGRLSVSCVRALVAAGADVNAQDASGKTVLMKLACPCEFDERNADGVRALLALGANPNLVDANGSTVLIECCSSGCRRMACALIDAGADVNIATRLTRTTALIEASRFGFNAVRIACALIAAGANIEHAAANGDTAYSVAADFMEEEKTDEQWAIRIVFDKIKSRLPYSCDSDDDAREVDAAGVRKITGEKLYAMIEASLCDDEARCFRQSAAASWS